jgi:hypothetical protein
MAYTGDRPFTGGALTHVTNDFRKPWPWTAQVCSEGWAALVGDDDWGVGIMQEDNCLFHGGLHGGAGSRDVRGAATAYLAPVRVETFDHDIVYEYSTIMTLGSLRDIRAGLLARAVRGLPAWEFTRSRSHWYVVGGSDDGPPRDGTWRIPVEQGAPQVVGPVRCWRAEDGPEVLIEAAWNGSSTSARLRWQGLGDHGFSDERSVAFTLPNDGAFHRVVVPLTGMATYQGLITGLRLDPPSAVPGAHLMLRTIVVQRSR